MLILRIPSNGYWHKLNKLSIFGQLIAIKKVKYHNGANLGQVLHPRPVTVATASSSKTNMMEVTAIIYPKTKEMEHEQKIIRCPLSYPQKLKELSCHMTETLLTFRSIT